MRLAIGVLLVVIIATAGAIAASIQFRHENTKCNDTSVGTARACVAYESAPASTMAVAAFASAAAAAVAVTLAGRAHRPA